MTMSPATIRPHHILASAGVVAAALGSSARAEQAADMGLRLPQLEPARSSEPELSTDLGRPMASIDEFRLNFQPGDTAAAPAASAGAKPAPAADDLAVDEGSLRERPS